MDERVIKRIDCERTYQTDIKGYIFAYDKMHTQLEWTAIIQHELGELAGISLHSYDNHNPAWIQATTKIAAVAVAALEANTQ